MRLTLLAQILLATGAAAVTAPAAAQDLGAWQYEQLRAEQEFARQRSIAQSNELMAMEARLRAESAIRDLQFSRALPVQAPTLPYPSASATPSGRVDAVRLPSIPDAALAESNRRVQDAARNRR